MGMGTRATIPKSSGRRRRVSGFKTLMGRSVA
jgi:hypothetical protein